MVTVARPDFAGHARKLRPAICWRAPASGLPNCEGHDTTEWAKRYTVHIVYAVGTRVARTANAFEVIAGRAAEHQRFVHALIRRATGQA